MTIAYSTDRTLAPEEFVELLRASTLGERRPIDDRECVEGMLRHGNLLVTAWDGDRLVGVARSVTDFHYACYLSDLAVRKEYQRQGIGKELQRRTRAALGPRCSVILLAAPAAAEYYGPVGYVHMPRCWVLPPEGRIV